MADALNALEQVSVAAADLTSTVARTRGKFVDPLKVRLKAKEIALTYYESIRSELEPIHHDTLIDELDFLVSAILQLTSEPRKKSPYLKLLGDLRPTIQQAMIEVMKARGQPRLVLSPTEKGIHATLGKMLPATAASYEQVLRDITEGKRVSWKGPGTELREVLREVIDHLAPDDKVMAAPGFKLDGELKRPTQKQKVRFILKARRAPGTSVATAEASLETFEEGIATLARSTYQRGSVSAHTATDGSEIKKLKGYVDALLVDVLEIAT